MCRSIFERIIIRGEEEECAYSFAEVTSGDIPALFVFRVAASSTSVDGHTWWFIEDVGRSPELPAHVDTHFPGHALSLPPLRLYTCTHTEGQITTTTVQQVFFCSRCVHGCIHKRLVSKFLYSSVAKSELRSTGIIGIFTHKYNLGQD